VFGGFFDLESKKNKLEEIEGKISGIPDFWTKPEISAPILKEKKIIEANVQQAQNLKNLQADLDAAIELSSDGDEETLAEAESILLQLESLINTVETQSLLSHELDINDAVITINAGAGGTESCDWAAMLFRMYVRYAERKGWKTEIYDLLDGEEAGIKNATMGVSGEFAFGLLKSESGVHRLVRISPFDSNARRHTSFASVYISPVIDDNIEIDIKDSDLRIDTYRASGAGGQHVNRTDSAVRMTHLPTGIVVQCQSQRSQHQNRDQAMKLLRSRLYEHELEKRRVEQERVENAKTDISWGHQIRSYVLHPYKLVKDHRTDYESHSPDEVLDGSLDTFVNSFLTQKATAKQTHGV
jgi:peptide chain release factor 2